MRPFLNVDSMTLIANGFLPTRASWMLDFVVVAMLGVMLILFYSIYQIRIKNKPSLHRNIQIMTAIILTVVLIAFEIDVRFITAWRDLAEVSPFYDSGTVDRCLLVHLLFAIPTPVIWAIVIVMGLRGFKSGFSQGNFNRIHRISGRIAAVFMLMTALTGWIFYYVAFVA
jgi:putative membrane protein